jgi:hypothetical protein
MKNKTIFRRESFLKQTQNKTILTEETRNRIRVSYKADIKSVSFWMMS